MSKAETRIRIGFFSEKKWAKFSFEAQKYIRAHGIEIIPPEYTGLDPDLYDLPLFDGLKDA